MDYIRKKFLVMRGLRPENIYIDSNGYPKLAGFGWSKKIRGVTSTRIGGMDFTAPECLVGHEHDATADVWSLGAIIYNLATGSVPFTNATKEKRNAKEAGTADVMMTYSLMRKGLVGFPIALPVKMQNLIRQCMDPFPDQRITYGDPDMKDIIKHTWFKEFQWDQLEEGLLEAPWVPFVEGPEDLQNFTKVPAKEKVVKWSEADEAMSAWEPDFW